MLPTCCMWWPLLFLCAACGGLALAVHDVAALLSSVLLLSLESSVCTYLKSRPLKV